MSAAAVAAQIDFLTGSIIHVHQMRSIAAVRKFGLFFGEIIEPLIRTAETAEQTGVLNQRNQFIRIAVGRNIRNIAAGFPVRPVIGLFRISGIMIGRICPACRKNASADCSQ